MRRPKNFLFLILLLTVVAVVLAVAIDAAREPRPEGQPPFGSEAGRLSPSPAFVSRTAAPDGTPSAAAQKRAKEFNDATNRFNAPDDQPR